MGAHSHRAVHRALHCALNATHIVLRARISASP
jgi:hypothetical protein